jgi:hypothetical protein
MDSGVVIGLASGIGGAAAGASVCYAVVKAMVNMTMRKYEDLESEVKSLRDDKIAGIEKRLEKVDEHRKCEVHGESLLRINTRLRSLEDGQTVVARMGANLDNVVGWTRTLDAKMDSVRQDIAALKAVVKQG